MLKWNYSHYSKMVKEIRLMLSKRSTHEDLKHHVEGIRRILGHPVAEEFITEEEGGDIALEALIVGEVGDGEWG